MAVTALLDHLTEQVRATLEQVVPTEEEVLFQVSMEDFPLVCEHGEPGRTAGVAFWLSVPVQDSEDGEIRAQTGWTVRVLAALDEEWLSARVRESYQEMIFERVSFHEEMAEADGEEPGPTS